MNTYYARAVAPAARISDRMLTNELDRRAADAIRACIIPMMHTIKDAEEASPEWVLTETRIMMRNIRRIESTPRRIMALLSELEG